MAPREGVFQIRGGVLRIREGAFRIGGGAFQIRGGRVPAREGGSRIRGGAHARGRRLYRIPLMRVPSLSLLLVTMTLAALFGAPSPVSADALPPYTVWEKRIKKIDTKLLKKDWAGAHADARAVLTDALAEPAVGRPFLASAVGRLAAAEAGLGRQEDALWHWQTARNLSRQPVPKEVLAKLGPPGELLGSLPERRRLDEAPAGMEVPPAGAPGVVPAKKVAGDLPVQSKVLQAISVPKWMRLQAVIDAEGRLRDPVVVTAIPEMTWEVLEAARSWRFEPGRKDGVPVATFYELEVNAPAEKPLAEMIELHPDLAAFEALLRAGRWQEAKTKGEETWQHAVNWGEASRGYFAVALMFRALAAAATGAEDVAICQWQGAQSLVPSLFHVDLSPYGEAGALLESRRWGWRSAQVSDQDSDTKKPSPGTEVIPPKLLDRPVQPQYTEAAKRTGRRGIVILNMVIDETGALRDPWVPQSIEDSKGLEATAMDAACHWRFQPASFGGRPVAVRYSLTVNFQNMGVPAGVRRGS
jgi:TonB family protein